SGCCKPPTACGYTFEMGTNRGTNEEVDVNSDAVDEVVCLSDDGNPTTPTQADGSETAAAVETREHRRRV
ncbi:Tetraspanin-2, partial [Bienertia sinuspersici]